MDFWNTPKELFTYYAKLRGHEDPEKTAEEIIALMSIS